MVSAGRLASAVLLAIVGVSGTARAENQTAPPAPREDGLRLSFGLGGSVTGVPAHPRAAVPLEVTLVPVPFSASAGAVLSSLGVEDAYVEGGLWLGASVGLGIGYGRRETSRGIAWDPVGPVFVGLPIPLADPSDPFQLAKRTWLPYLLPYYRPSWDLSAKRLTYELGLMIKISYAIRPTTIEFFDF